MPCSPPVGPFQSSQNLNSEVTSCEFYDNFCTHFLRIFDEKTCTEVVAVLTILYALGDMLFGINSTLSVSYTANPLKNSLLCVVQENNTGELQRKVIFLEKKSHQIPCSFCQGLPTKNFSVIFYFFIPSVNPYFIQPKKRKNIANTDLTPTTAVQVSPCKN